MRDKATKHIRRSDLCGILGICILIGLLFSACQRQAACMALFEEMTPGRQEVELQADIGQSDWQGMLDLDGVSLYWLGDGEVAPCRALTDSAGRLVQAEVLWPRCIELLKPYAPVVPADMAAEIPAGQELGDLSAALGEPLKVGWYDGGEGQGYLYFTDSNEAYFIRTKIEDGSERIVDSMIHRREYIPAPPPPDMEDAPSGYAMDMQPLAGYALFYPEGWKKNKDGYSTVYRAADEAEPVMRVDSHWLYEADSRNNREIAMEYLAAAAERSGWDISGLQIEDAAVNDVQAWHCYRPEGGICVVCITNTRLYIVQMAPEMDNGYRENILDSLRLFEPNAAQGIGRDLYPRTVAEAAG